MTLPSHPASPAGHPLHRPLCRRRFLRGSAAAVAAAVGLPWLESLATPADRAPVRFGVMLFANGVAPDAWWSRGNGESLELSPSLQPLAGLRDHLTIFKGLHVYNNTAGPHWPLFSNVLSGARFAESMIPAGGESIDQRIGREVGRETPLPSLVLGVEPAESGLRGGVPSIYYGTVSWTSPTTPVPPEVYPRATFDRLFDTRHLRRDRSVLDAVLADSRSIGRQLGHRDRLALDGYLEGIRDVERRIDRATRDNRLEGWRPRESPQLQRPPADLPQDVRDHMRLMCDLMILAWQMDRTRVATLLFNRDVSHMQFDFLDGVGKEQLHGISHHKNNPEKLAWYRRINTFHVEQLARMMEQMAAIDEGEGRTMLDNVMLLFGSNMRDGDIHDGRDLPLLVAGHGGGQIAGGRTIDVSERPEEEQRACNLYLSLARAMGLGIDSFGDGSIPLGGLA